MACTKPRLLTQQIMKYNTDSFLARVWGLGIKLHVLISLTIAAYQPTDLLRDSVVTSYAGGTLAGMLLDIYTTTTVYTPKEDTGNIFAILDLNV